MLHLFICDSNDFAPDVGSFIDCFIEMMAVSTVILPSFEQKSVNKDPTRMVGVLDKERIRGSRFSKTVIPLAFEV